VKLYGKQIAQADRCGKSHAMLAGRIHLGLIRRLRIIGVDEIKLISWTKMAQYGMFSVLNEGAGVFTTC